MNCEYDSPLEPFKGISSITNRESRKQPLRHGSLVFLAFAGELGKLVFVQIIGTSWFAVARKSSA
jgi:hypothetical protein